MTTPAQASANSNRFVTDWPVQGPTDPGIREADCRFMKTVLPTTPACVDCEGPIPMWAKSKGLLGERISFGVAAPGDPDVWTSLSTPQQQWVTATIIALDGKIRAQTPGSSCPGMSTGTITGIAGCFQNWFNSAKLGLTKPNGAPVTLRNDGVFDQDTLDALRTVAAMRPADFTTPFPGTEAAGTGIVAKKGLSTGAMVGIGTAIAAALGGVAYVATRKKTRKSSRRK